MAEQVGRTVSKTAAAGRTNSTVTSVTSGPQQRSGHISDSSSGDFDFAANWHFIQAATFPLDTSYEGGMLCNAIFPLCDLFSYS